MIIQDLHDVVPAIQMVFSYLFSGDTIQIILLLYFFSIGFAYKNVLTIPSTIFTETKIRSWPNETPTILQRRKGLERK